MKDSARRAMFAKQSWSEQRKGKWPVDKKQDINIKFPIEKSRLYLKNQTVHIDPVLRFEGKLNDGRPVLKIGKKWTYVV